MPHARYDCIFPSEINCALTRPKTHDTCRATLLYSSAMWFAFIFQLFACIFYYVPFMFYFVYATKSCWCLPNVFAIQLNSVLIVSFV
jgi:hypothetical protein